MGERCSITAVLGRWVGMGRSVGGRAGGGAAAVDGGRAVGGGHYQPDSSVHES